jgi:hypothetical protein
MRSFILNMTKYLIQLHCTCIFNYDVTEIFLQLALKLRIKPLMSKIHFIIFTLKVSLTTWYATIRSGGEKVTYQFKEGRSSACLTSIRI